MNYQGTEMSDALSVSEIYTVLRPDLVKSFPGRGEAHPFPEIIFISCGQNALLIDGKEFFLSQGQMIIYAPNSFHEASLNHPPVQADAAILTFAANSEILPTLYNRVITLSPRQQQMLNAIIDEGVEYFCGRDPKEGIGGMMLKDGINPSQLWGLKKQIEFFLIDVYKTDTEKAPPSRREIRYEEDFERTDAFLRAHLTEVLTLEEIAAACLMSVSKLKLLFREKAHMGPINYLILLRIEEAKRLMRESDLSLTQIAEQVGFTSLHYFSRMFKKVTGMAPSQYGKER